MQKIGIMAGALAVTAMATVASAAGNSPVVVTASNTPQNALLVFDADGQLVQSVSTQGSGGASGNAGGIAVQGDLVAVANFGSSSVALLSRNSTGFVLTDVVSTLSWPVSVAFGKDHLYVLGTTTIESHRLDNRQVDPVADGRATLLQADGSAAQVGVVGERLIVSEKSGSIEFVDLLGGAVAGTPRSIVLPAGADHSPFGLTTRGSSAYVTIASSDAVALIRNEGVLAVAATGVPGGSGQHSPCWAAISGPYLFSTNSPSHTVTRFIATGQSLTVDSPVAATTGGAPIDVAATDRLLALVETNADGTSHLTQYSIDGDGNLSPSVSTPISSSANGVAIVANQ